MLVSPYHVNNANFNIFQNYLKKEQQKLDSAITLHWIYLKLSLVQSGFLSSTLLQNTGEPQISEFVCFCSVLK